MAYSLREKYAIRVAPWLRPDPERDPIGYHTALRHAPDGPPFSQVGSVLLVATSERTVSLWGTELPGSDTDLASQARLAWNDALTAFARSTDLLWKSPESLLNQYVQCLKVATWVPPGKCEPDERTVGFVDGRSFGLPFLLSIASHFFEVPVPVNFAATGVVNTDGSVDAVQDVKLKLEAVAHRAPAIRRFLLPEENVKEAECVANRFGIQLISVTNARQALREVFGKRPEKRLLELLGEPEKIDFIVKELFLLTLMGCQLDLTWNAVANAAKLVASNEQLTKEQLFRVRFASAVALRHQSNEGLDIPVPTDQDLETQPAPIRLALVAHLVQHCADTGIPPLERVLELANRHLVRGKNAFVEHLRLLGALGRLLAICGSPEEGLSLSIEAAQGSYERQCRSDISRPLAMGLRLSGILKNRQAFQELDNLRRRITAEKWLSRLDSAFVNLSRSTACIELGMDEHNALEELKQLAVDNHIPEHVRFSALRWLLRGLRKTKEHEIANRLFEQFKSVAESENAPCDTRLFFALARLDLDYTDSEALESLWRLDRGPISHLCNSAKKFGVHYGEYVRTFYPY